MKQVNDRHTRRLAREHRMHLTDVRIRVAEIGIQDDHAWILTVFPPGAA